MAKKTPKQIFGMLSTVTVELPYESEAAQKKADKMNEQLKKMGVRTFRAADDWGYRRYEDTATAALNKQKPDPRKGPKVFRSGDLVQVFKTVTDGDVQWQGTIDYDRSDYHHGLQKGLSAEAWGQMFNDTLPSRLERKDGTVLYGSLEPFCETGTEGVIWSVHEYGKAGYEGLHCLKEGDKLVVYNTVRDGDLEWQGTLDFGLEKVAKVGWSEVMRQTKHIPTDKWLEWSWQSRPVAVTPKL